MAQWFFSCNGVQQGPVAEEELVARARRGELKRDDFVWKAEYGQQWKRAGSVDLFFPPGSAEVAAPTAAPAWAASGGGTGQMPPNHEITAAARQALRGCWGPAIGFTVVYALLCIGTSVVAGFLGAIAPLLQVAVTWLVMPCLAVGLMMFFLAIARGGTPEFSLLFGGFPRFGTAVGSYLLTVLFTLLWVLAALVPVGLFVGVMLATAGSAPLSNPDEWSPGLRAMVVLGAVYYVVALAAISLRYSLVMLAAADRDSAGPLGSVRRSVRLMKGRKWQFLRLGFRMVGWAILSLMTCGIGLLWLVPYYTTAVAVFYDRAQACGRT